jgi:hypothetical protein
MILCWIGAASAAAGSGQVIVGTPTMTGETFVKVTGASNAGTSGHGQVACYAVNSANGGHNVVNVSTSGAGGANDVHIHVQEITGQIASPQDATGNTESTTISVSTSGSTSTANDLIIAFFYDDINNRTYVAESSPLVYAQIDQTNNVSGGDAAFSESLTVSSTGIKTATATGTSGDTIEQGIIAIAGTASANLTFEDDSYNTNLAWPVEPQISVW